MTTTQILARVSARNAHLRFCEQRFDKCSPDVSDTLAVAHDLLGMPAPHWVRDDEELYEYRARHVADMLVVSQRVFPVSAAGVWPNGTPAHWLAVAS